MLVIVIDKTQSPSRHLYVTRSDDSDISHPIHQGYQRKQYQRPYIRETMHSALNL